MFGQAGKRLMQPLLRSRYPKNPILQRRSIHPIAGPPQEPLTGKEQWLLGGGFIFTIMLIPTWGLYSVPRWAEIHQRHDYA